MLGARIVSWTANVLISISLVSALVKAVWNVATTVVNFIANTILEINRSLIIVVTKLLVVSVLNLYLRFPVWLPSM